MFGATTAEAADFEPTAAQLIETAGHAAELVAAVTPGADLGGELDVLHSLRTLVEGRALGHTVAETLADIARVVAEALCCELAIAWLPDGPLQVHEAGWTLLDGRELLDRIMQEQWEVRDTLSMCVQDAVETPLAYPLDPTRGVRSYCVLPIGDPPAGLLLVAHTEVAPQGFTKLQLIRGEQLAVIADSVLAAATLREQLVRAVETSPTPTTSWPG